jgi:hypothetical protein
MTDVRESIHEFWARLHARDVEPDLRATLQQRAQRAGGAVSRVGSASALNAVINCIVPGSAVPAGVIAEFVDANFDRQMGRGDERLRTLPRAELIPAGLALLEAANFAAMSTGDQRDMLARAEHGGLPGPDGFDSALWFTRLRELVLLAYASDPRGMTEMGFPGPSYKPGYVWLRWGGADARAKKRPGHRRF